MDEIYVIMNFSEIFEDVFYTNENRVAKRVRDLNEVTNSERFWYKTLSKG